VAGAGTSTRLSVAADGAFLIRQTGQRLGHHPLRNLISADGELNAREAEHVVWDVIAVGTGMGGCVGYRLARSGRRVPFVKKTVLDRVVSRPCGAHCSGWRF